MKRLFLFAILILLSLSVYSIDNKVGEYMGIKFGTSMEDTKELLSKKYEDILSLGNTIILNTIIDDIDVMVTFSFFEDKFYLVYVSTKEPTAYDAFLYLLILKYGQPTDSTESDLTRSYSTTWDQGKFEICLREISSDTETFVAIKYSDKNLMRKAMKDLLKEDLNKM
ncbi:MAG: hypothetical protein WC910_10100 [Bacteroidales bacterium]